jgi:hypothetical protein
MIAEAEDGRVSMAGAVLSTALLGGVLGFALGRI